MDEILVEKITAKEGMRDDGSTYVRHSIKDANGEWYSTFDGDLVKDLMEGKRARIKYESKAYKGRILKNLVAAEPIEGGTGTQVPATHAARTPDGEPDWDLKQLRINRCAAWNQILGPAMSAGISAFSRAAEGKYDTAQLAGFVQKFGRALRQIAEADIYLSRPVEDENDWIPFEPKSQNGDIEI